MPHSLIIGMTESGKSFLAKEKMKRYQSAGIKTMVLDPTNSGQWGADYQSADVGEFLDVFWNSRKCAVFFDEAGDYIHQHADRRIIQTATRGRHLGHNCYYIGQRGTMINTTVRGQCRNLFLFRVGIKDAKHWSEEFAQPELANATALGEYEFYSASKIKPGVERWKTDPKKGAIKI